MGRVQLFPVALPVNTEPSLPKSLPLLCLGMTLELLMSTSETQERVLKASSKMLEASRETPYCQVDPAKARQAQRVSARSTAAPGDLGRAPAPPSPPFSSPIRNFAE